MRGDDARVVTLSEQAATLKARIESLGLPRGDKARKLLEYELTKIRLELRAVRTKRVVDRRRLIPYAGAERD